MISKNYKDWTIMVSRIVDGVYGKGLEASIFIKKLDGTKRPLYIFQEYDGNKKTLGEMMDFAIKFIDGKYFL